MSVVDKIAAPGNKYLSSQRFNFSIPPPVGTLTIVRFRIIGDKIITRTCKLPLTYVTLNDRLVDIRGVPIVCLLSVLSIK